MYISCQYALLEGTSSKSTLWEWNHKSGTLHPVPQKTTKKTPFNDQLFFFSQMEWSIYWKVQNISKPWICIVICGLQNIFTSIIFISIILQPPLQ